MGTGYVGTFAIGAIDGNSVDWNFVADNSALQFLSANQTVTQTYAVTLTDSVGGSTTQNVTVQLHGVNDAVVITSNDGNALRFLVCGRTDGGDHHRGVSDVDVGDTVTWSLSGADASFFDISNAGVITFKNAPDFESAAGCRRQQRLRPDRQRHRWHRGDRHPGGRGVPSMTATFPSGTNNNIQIREDVMLHVQAAPISASATPTATRLVASPSTMR